MARQLWWKCSLNHIGTIPGKCCNTQEQLTALMGRIEKLHHKLHPQCKAYRITVGASKRGLENNVGTRSAILAPNINAGTVGTVSTGTLKGGS